MKHFAFQQTRNQIHSANRSGFNEKRQIPVGICRFLAEEKGFEPLQHFHALRDFESRLFDQLEYSSV